MSLLLFLNLHIVCVGVGREGKGEKKRERLAGAQDATGSTHMYAVTINVGGK